MRTRLRGSALFPLAALIVAVAACSPEQSPTAIDGPQFTIGENPAQAWICKIGPEGTTADFTVAMDGPGQLLLGEDFTLSAYPECVWGVNTFYFWEADSPRPDPLVNTTLTVTEVDATTGLELTLIDYAQYLDGTYSLAYPPATSATITVNYDFGGRFKFVNEGEPSGGGEGCTPGYWRQPQHFDSYPAPYAPDTPFDDVFDDAFGDMTLAEVAALGGGGLNALGRHAVAALLNAASGDVDYPMTSVEVIEAFNLAYAGGDYENQKDAFEMYNEAGCSLD